MLSDLRLALRSLRKSPGFTIIALLTLALGIGVNTSMFSLVDSLLFQRGPFPQPDRLHMIIADTPRGESRNYSVDEVSEIRSAASSFTALTTISNARTALVEPGKPAEQVPSVRVSREFFDTFQRQPFLGRPFAPAEYEPGRNQVVLLSYPFWQRRFGGDPHIVGRSLRLDGDTVTIIGVMPEDFTYRFLWDNAALWRPLNYTPDQVKQREYRAFNLVGRLADGANAEQAGAELAPIATRQQTEFPQTYRDRSYRATVLHEALMDDESRRIVWMLLGLSGFVLLIACANLANLQLARATVAMRELAIRTALGASRSRLIRQQLTESLLIAAVGGVFGLGLALAINRTLSADILINGEANVLALPINLTVLTVTALVSLLTGIIFGIVPAWLSSRASVVESLKSQSRGSTGGRGQHRMRQALIVAEVTLALVLLGGAGVMQRGFAKYLQRDVGWDTEHMLAAELSMPEHRFPNDESRIAFYRAIETRVGALPGVESVSLSSGLPIWGYGTERQILTESQAASDLTNQPYATTTLVTSGFFPTIGVTLLEGRNFASDVAPGDPLTVVINDRLARQFWPNQRAVGQRLGLMDGQNVTWHEVIGVVPTTLGASSMGPPRTFLQVFRPFVHEPWTWARLAVRSAKPAGLIEAVRRAVADVDPDMPANELLTVRQTVDRNQHNLTVVAKLLSAFALLGLGLGLAAVGLYGVISNVVAQRTDEFGIRLALGASPRNILTLVLNHGLRLTLIGIALGLVGAFGLSRLLASIMPLMVSADGFTLGGTAVLLFIVAALACWIPSRRATRVNPMVALRND